MAAMASRRSSASSAAASASQDVSVGETATSSKVHGDAGPPPLQFLELDVNERLPRPSPPSDPEILKAAEELVVWAVSSKHENSPEHHPPSNDSSSNEGGENGANGQPNNPAVIASAMHHRLATLLNRRSNAPLLHAVLHSIITANSGRELDRLVGHSKLHAQLIHLIVRLDPFVPLAGDGEKDRGMEGLRALDKARCERRRRALTNSGKKPSVKIDEASIRHKEDAKFVSPAVPYFSYEMADAHLHLLVALVSNNSIMSRSVVRSLWGLLTDFGGRWTEWANGRLEGERRGRRLQRLQSNNSDAAKGAEEGEEGKDGEEGNEPATKRQKVDDTQSKPQAATPNLTAEGMQEEEESEGERPVPGMSGLSVDFVREAFYGDDGCEEVIGWDRLASGRVRRLLLALLNVFRLCPRSKTDLLSILASSFPHHKTCPPPLYAWYIRQCLQMVRLVPSFEGLALALFVDKALDMDVEIKIGERGLVTLDASPREDVAEGESGKLEGVTRELFGGEAATPTTMAKKRSFHQISNDSLSSMKATNAEAANNDESAFDESDQVLEISERLDTLMTALYGRIVEATAFDPTSLSSAMAAVLAARRLHRHLDAVFDEKVRTTDRSKFVQFAFLVLFGRENDALEAVGRLMAERETQQQKAEVDLGPINVTDPLYRGFSAKLIEFFYDPSHAGDVLRQTVVCYLASFVSRATYVCPETVCECVAALLRWAEVYVSTQPGEGAEGNGRTPAQSRSMRRLSSTASLGKTQHACEVHGLFYTACQAAFYIMCFRGAEAIGYYRKACEHRDDPDSPYADPESVDIGPQRWKSLCGHALQPLKYCLESVRVEFLHLADELDLFVDTTDSKGASQEEDATKLLDHLWSTSMAKGGKDLPHGPDKIKSDTPKKRRRTIISTAATQEKKRLAGGVGGLGRGSNPLDSFFPFDPYLLQKSYEHVHPYYRNWEDCILTLEDMAYESDENEEVVGAEDGDSEVSDLEDEEEAAGEEEDSDNDEDDEDEDEEDASAPKQAKSTKSPTGVSDEDNLEMEIRRSRAMSTGSQCSW